MIFSHQCRPFEKVNEGINRNVKIIVDNLVDKYANHPIIKIL